LLLEVKEEIEAELRDDLASLKPEEAAVLTLLEARLNRDLKTALNESVAALDMETTTGKDSKVAA
jgi:DNA topoisomerase-1